ncbi:helix-turn-helix domain-containing protein [Bacillus kwashiorkori]|uniref:helix-turn-helix domain-containing protein n=1 Tax=Bacillus kwashiorkori TaxID=1522318 RepID=UPI000780F4D1|nr:helix-turn-helix domain-containing protein [Bacillus kwashiorkori]
MNYLAVIVLYCVEKFSNERSIQAIFNLLKGKKSAQTIQDAVWFSLRQLFSQFPMLSESEFQSSIQQLKRNGFIERKETDIFITELGHNFLTKQLMSSPIPKQLDGIRFYHIDQIFWQRLSLLIQTLSHLNYNESRFYPVERNFHTQQWVKNWLIQNGSQYTKKELVKSFSLELLYLMEIIEQQMDPNIFIYRLTNRREPGFTPNQIASLLNMDIYYYHLCFQSFLHFMLSTIWHNKKDYPLLFQLIENDYRNIPLTKSAFTTYRLLQNGNTVEQISKIRRLKRNTVEDHLVEIALHDDHFEIDQYVPKELQRKIVSIINVLQTRKLKVIKSALPEADFLSIRLVLSRINGQLESPTV